MICVRFLDGVADAAAWSSIVPILMIIYPSKESTGMYWTEASFGIGTIIGNDRLTLLDK